MRQEVRNQILCLYIEQCKLHHLLAFMQWRLHFSNKVASDKNKELLVEMIESIQNKLEQNQSRLLKNLDL